MSQKIYLIGSCVEDSSIGVYANFLMKEFKKYKQYKIIDKRFIYDPKIGKIQYIYKYIKYVLSLHKLSDGIILELSTGNIIPPILLRNSVKKVHIVHDLFYYDHEESFSKLMNFYYNYIHKTLYRLIFKRADVLIAISKSTKQDILDKFGKQLDKKIEIVNNGVDISMFVPNGTKKDIYMLYIGSEADRKNLKNIINSFAIVHKKYPDLKLIKAPMEKDINSRNKTLSYIKNCGLELNKDVIFIDKYLTLQELISLYQGASVFVFPSLEEGFGFPIIEAQACGVPVITSNIEPMCSLVPYNDMLVNPHDSDNIAKNIIKILENKQLALDMKNKGLENSKKFSWENTVKRFVEIFNSL